VNDTYDLFAIRYAHHDRTTSQNFLGGDPHDGPMPLDFFVWAIVGNKQSFVSIPGSMLGAPPNGNARCCVQWTKGCG
jgi:hypothetical protein